MIKWEYLALDMDENCEDDFANLGKDGWELVSVVVTGKKLAAFFKRPLP